MRKLSDASFDPLPLRRPGPARLVATILAALLLGPLVFDGAKIVVARWRGMFGAAQVVDTPALDAVSVIVDRVRDTFRAEVGTILRPLPWRADAVVLGLILCALLAGLALHRRAAP